MTSQQRQYTTGRGWVNIDDCVGVVVSPAKHVMIDRPFNNNSVMTALLYASYNDEPRHYKAGDVVDRRHVVFYSNVTSEQTRQLARTHAH